jgi:hypothetical protein
MTVCVCACACLSHAHVYHYLVSGLCPSSSFSKNNAKWMCCWGGLADLRSHGAVVGAYLLTLPSNDRSRSVSKAAQWVQQWLDCLIAAVSMPWSTLGSPQHDLAALCPFQKHLVCRQNIQSITNPEHLKCIEKHLLLCAQCFPSDQLDSSTWCQQPASSLAAVRTKCVCLYVLKFVVIASKFDICLTMHHWSK